MVGMGVGESVGLGINFGVGVGVGLTEGVGTGEMAATKDAVSARIFSCGSSFFITPKVTASEARTKRRKYIKIFFISFFTSQKTKRGQKGRFYKSRTM